MEALPGCEQSHWPGSFQVRWLVEAHLFIPPSVCRCLKDARGQMQMLGRGRYALPLLACMEHSKATRSNNEAYQTRASGVRTGRRTSDYLLLGTEYMYSVLRRYIIIRSPCVWSEAAVAFR